MAHDTTDTTPLRAPKDLPPDAPLHHPNIHHSLPAPAAYHSLEEDPRAGLSTPQLLALHKTLILPRLIEEKMLKLLRQGRLGKWFSGIGQEAIAVGVTSALQPDDYILPMHRNLGVFTTRGITLKQLFCQLMGRGRGFTQGRDRSFHFGTPEHHLVGMISHLGAMLPVADGLALAFKLRGTQRLAAPFTGDGATSEGDFHEALNLAAVWKLPVLFIIENNRYGLSTPISEQFACEDLADRAAGYGMPGEIVDGNDLLEVFDAVRRAARRARSGEGPTLLEFKTFRMRGHEESSGVAYVPSDLFEQWARKDPIERFEQKLLSWEVIDPQQIHDHRQAIIQSIDETVDEVLEIPPIEANLQRELGAVYAPVSAPTPPNSQAPHTQMRYVDAIQDAMRIALERDETVLLIGQDVAEYGGAFKASQGFIERFGRHRIRNTPIIESAAIGAAMGLALEGFRPILEIQFADFVTCGFNQIVNNLAKNHYRWGSAINVTIRMPSGGGLGAGPFHSQNPEAWFTHVAGLKVVAPATPEDAKGLLLASLEDPNPVIFLEHKWLYRSLRGKVPEGYYTTPLGKARLARTGADASIITYGVGVPWALEAAKSLSGEGISIEVLDLRTLLPMDEEAILATARKTSRVLVLHEAPLTGGVGGEIAARVAQKAFDWLDAPVIRVGALDTPTPFSKALEAQFSAQSRLLAALKTLLSY